MEQRGTTGDSFKQLYSHISQITYHITVTWTSYNWTSPFKLYKVHSITRTRTITFTSLQLHYNSLWREEKNNNGVKNN